MGSITLIMLMVVCYSVSVRASRDEAKAVTVKPGDTLWAIAAQHGDPRDDIRKVIFEIKRLNGLDSSAVSPGQVLRVPVR